MYDPLPILNQYHFPKIKRTTLQTLQINIGLKCNQQCLHCHVNASPKRKEMMSDETIALIKKFIAQQPIEYLDITGGAPELHPKFRMLVEDASAQNIKVIDRCNLTVLLEPNMSSLPEFLAKHQVEIIASLPCYLEENVDKQRGQGVFKKSISALQRLNEQGYGQDNTGLKLSLVYNPQGPVLPPDQQDLQTAYKKQLYEHFGILFNELYTLCNMPIKRFGSTLISNNQLIDYMTLLQQAHQDQNLEKVMCRSLLSINWQGYVYDCDFNQMLSINLSDQPEPIHLSTLLDQDLSGQNIAVRGHCYGCTAGQGSSCQGALS